MPVLSSLRPPATEDVAAPVRFSSETVADRDAVDALVARAFGPGRYAKTAERLREGANPRSDLSLCAWRGDGLVGAVRLWSARVGDVPVLFLGPIAVEGAVRGQGLGGELVAQACRRARAAGERAVVLVGDLGFFGPLGFTVVPTGAVRPPGPVDPGRLLWTALEPGGLDGAAGELAARRPA